MTSAPPPVFSDEDDPMSDHHVNQQSFFYVVPSLPSPRRARMDKQTRALRFVARLRQPLGALLLAPICEDGVEYKSVATDSMIVVRVQEDPGLSRLLRKRAHAGRAVVPIRGT
jgi:hypothetical protein